MMGEMRERAETIAELLHGERPEGRIERQYWKASRCRYLGFASAVGAVLVALGAHQLSFAIPGLGVAVVFMYLAATFRLRASEMEVNGELEEQAQ